MTFQQFLQCCPAFLIALSLIASAVGLMTWHLKAKKSLDGVVTDAREHIFRRWQIRRRIQISGMLGVLGVAIAIGQSAMILGGRNVDLAFFLLSFWGGILLLVLWILLLAIGDMVATHYHFSRMRTDFAVERAQLQAEARRAAAVQSNGKLGHGTHGALGAD